MNKKTCEKNERLDAYHGYRPTEILCSCHRIRARTVVDVIQMVRTNNVMDIMTRCGAGESCQCCVPEIARLVEKVLGGSADTSGY